MSDIPQNSVCNKQKTAILRKWLHEHFTHPYCTPAEEVELAAQTQMTRKQIKNWFVNARKRIWKPLMAKLSESGQSVDGNLLALTPPNLQARSTSNFRGVCAERGKWRAQITYDGKKHFLGTFGTEREAALAYDMAALRHHGAKAVTNFKHPTEIIQAATASSETSVEPTRTYTSKFRGVSAWQGKWRAYICYRGRNHFLGRFDSQEEAARAYDVAALRLHGPRAKTNFGVNDEVTAKKYCGKKRKACDSEQDKDFLLHQQIEKLARGETDHHIVPKDAQEMDSATSPSAATVAANLSAAIADGFQVPATTFQLLPAMHHQTGMWSVGSTTPPSSAHSSSDTVVSHNSPAALAFAKLHLLCEVATRASSNSEQVQSSLPGHTSFSASAPVVISR